jgi:hypothetical protein
MAKAKEDDATILAADTDFQRQQAAIQRALAQYRSGQTAQAGARKLDLSNAYNTLGYNPDANSFDVFDKQRGYAQATNAARQNFAGRGMLRSSGYGAARAGVGKQFEEQASNLRTGQQQFETGQTSDLQAFEADQADTLAAAREAALRRRQDALRAGMF